MIALNNISVTFNPNTPLERTALRTLTLRILPGEFITVIGSNGSGKSTLMNLLAGNVKASHGSIFIDNRNVTKMTVAERSGFVSRVFQEPTIGSCPNLTLAENMALAFRRGHIRSLKTALDKTNRSHFRKLIANLGLGLEDRLDEPMEQLSGGQRQAISLLMATLQPSKILLLDEHTASLDPKMAKRVMAITTQLITNQKLTTLMVTHSMTDALEYGDRTLLMHEGQIAKDIAGKERKTLTPYDLLTLFEL